jgi:hypothetical protein
MNVMPDPLPDLTPAPLLIYGGDASQEFENNELHFDNKGSEESGTAKILIPCVLTTTSFYGQGKKSPRDTYTTCFYWKELSMSNAELMGNFDVRRHFKNKAHS